MNATHPLVLISLVLSLAGCSGGDGDTGTDIAGESRAVDLSFPASVGGEAVSCSATYASLGGTGVEAGLGDARLFVSGLQLRAADGTWIDVTLDQDSDWQHGGVALLDWEDGTGGCADSGNSNRNDHVTGQVPVGDYDAVRFDVGVPDALNHNDTATAPAPLNAPGMFWTWQTGFKHLRVDFLPQGGEIARWNVHVGSTGCSSEAATTPPDAPCDNPNRSAVLLEGFSLDQSVVAVDLAALVATADLGADVVDSPPGCMSSPVEPEDCGPVFAQLALDLETGECVDDCAAQAVFTLE